MTRKMPHSQFNRWNPEEETPERKLRPTRRLANQKGHTRKFRRGVGAKLFCHQHI